ncbi:hypothetical protein SAMD00023353_0102270 [Rosellinia necatrix]|uniref:Uncharacterized protein n=1 Tax=Rosellinia necatrix TaxID=77044 RepID=A0A1S8A5S3_ROSNE|nr:hypothetical protein SAMD00023353_0102270 [Rosellinia necatrix]
MSMTKGNLARAALQQPRLAVGRMGLPTPGTSSTATTMPRRQRSAVAVLRLGYLGEKLFSPDDARVVASAEILLRIYEEQGKGAEIEELKGTFPAVGRHKARTSVDGLPLPRWRLKSTP